MELLLVDTDVTVDFLRRRQEAVAFFEHSASQIQFSVVTHAELFAGARDSREGAELDAFLRGFPCVEISREIAKRAGLMKARAGAATGMGLADALIAATAQSIGATLVSLNEKHFNSVVELRVPYRKD